MSIKQGATVKKRSLIKKYFPMELLIEIYRITRLSDFSNNEKGMMMKELLTEWKLPWESLGPGTNRMGIQIDGYAIKIALDEAGMIDNKREMLYTKELQPYVIKVYECLDNGLLAVSEYVDTFSMDNLFDYQNEMRRILKEVSQGYLIGDVGIVRKNYANWGIRSNGEIVMLDYAYVYSTSYSVFRCECSDEALLQYDNNYNLLICPKCGKKYEFREIRRRITRDLQNKEIGDIKRLGYNMHEAEEVFPYNAKFEPTNPEHSKKKKLSPDKLDFKRAMKLQKIHDLYQKGKIDEDEYEELVNQVEDWFNKKMEEVVPTENITVASAES